MQKYLNVCSVEKTKNKEKNMQINSKASRGFTNYGRRQNMNNINDYKRNEIALKIFFNFVIESF